MFLLQSDEILEHLSGIIHRDTQQQDLHIDLTVGEIHRFTRAGSLDFGGSEFEPAGSEAITPEKKNPDDKYGWWDLKPGMYKMVFNESLDNPDNIIALISLHKHAEEAGLISSSVAITKQGKINEISMNFQVPEAGCNIKENARFAMLHMVKG